MDRLGEMWNEKCGMNRPEAMKEARTFISGFECCCLAVAFSIPAQLESILSRLTRASPTHFAFHIPHFLESHPNSGRE